MADRRPESIPYPNVWRRFSGKIIRDNGKTLRYRIQDATEDMYEELVEFIMTQFMPDAVLPKRINIAEDKACMDYLRDYYRRNLAENITIVAVIDDDDNNKDGGRPKIVGVNVLHAAKKNEKPETIPANCKKIKLWFECVDYVSKKINPFEHYGVDEYLGARGLSVHRDFRGEGISLELLKGRLDIGKALGFKASVTIFTSYGSQKMAARAGFDVLVDVPYAEYKHNGVSIFDGAETPTGKYMGILI